MPKLFIGMPVYNGAAFLAAALDSLISQKFRDWTMVISDNASSDGTERICREYCGKDGRLRYVRQAQNLGPLGNFQWLTGQAESEYFMWAAADDLWHEDFISACLSNLEARRDCHLSFCNLANIDSFGRRVREYPSFNRLASPDRRENVARLAAEPEIMGKANLIYSVYRAAFLRNLLAEVPFSGCWAGDVVFVLSALSRSFLALDERVLFMKRITRATDIPAEAHTVTTGQEGDLELPLPESFAYAANCLRALRGTPYLFLGGKIMVRRLAWSCARSLKGKFHKL